MEQELQVQVQLNAGRRRRKFFILGIAILVLSSGSFWLNQTGTLALPAAPTPAGAVSGGTLSTFTALTPSTVSIAQGQGAQIVNGMLLGKVTVAAGYAPSLYLGFSWLNPQSAGAVLNNPNAWISFGLYYPIHTGTCVNGVDPTNSLSITDTVTVTGNLCVTLNTQASGPTTYDGKLTLNERSITGFMLETKQDPVSPPTCAATGTTWCSPSGLAVNQNIFYTIASINTPGGAASGQQSQLTNLNFFISALTK